MPINRKANEAGVFSPSELALLQRVFDQTEIVGETVTKREARASRIISHFLAGILEEGELVTLSRQPL